MYYRVCAGTSLSVWEGTHNGGRHGERRIHHNLLETPAAYKLVLYIHGINLSYRSRWESVAVGIILQSL